jgi:mannose-6-phosphate isomerase-like protein (cupin superfamily)
LPPGFLVLEETVAHMRVLTTRSALATLTLVVAVSRPPSLPAQAATRPSVAHLSAAELRALTDSLATVAAQQPGRQVPGRPLGRDSGLAVFLLRRDTSGRPEVHEYVDEVFMVQAGRAVVVSGGRVEGAGLMEPGEWNGGRIVPDTAGAGGQGRRVVRRPAGSGDVVVIPAGVPHQVEVAAGESVTYLVFKARAVAPPSP